VRQRRGRLVLCVDATQKAQFERSSNAVGPERIEDLLQELFRLHDLNKNGTLEESELIKINEKIAFLHQEKVDLKEVEQKYRDHYRSNLNAEGDSVTYEVFRNYWMKTLQEHDNDPRVHEMILEQCTAEAESARQAFFIPDFQCESDALFRSLISQRGPVCQLPPTSRASVATAAQDQAHANSAFGMSFEVRKPLPKAPTSVARAVPSSKVDAQPPKLPVASRPCSDSLISDFVPAPEHTAQFGGGVWHTPDSMISDFVPAPEHTARLGLGYCPSFSSDFVPAPSPPATNLANEPIKEESAPTLGRCDSTETDFVPSPASQLHGAESGACDDYAPSSAPARLAKCNSFDSDFVPSGADDGTFPLMAEETMSNGTDSWVPPHLALKANESWPSTGGGLSGISRASSDSMGQIPSSTLPPGSSSGNSPAVGTLKQKVLPRFPRGASVQVWSESRQAWFEGVVEEAFSTETLTEGFRVPAGALKVSSAAGTKWVMPEHAAMTLREGVAPTSPTGVGLAGGQKVQVWSNSRAAWLDATVLEVFTKSSIADGFKVPAGTVKVSSSAGHKWIQPAEVGTTLRKPETNAAAKSSTGPVAVPMQTRAQQGSASEGAGFVKGEKIQVWSDSRQLWLGGVVEEVYQSSVSTEGFAVPAGSIKVVSAAGIKWVPPVLAGRVLRKVDISGGYTTSDLQAQLAEVVRSPAKLQKYVDAVWAAARCGDAGLPISRVAWALEGLALQFDVVINLEGRHLAVVQERLAALGHTGLDGRLNQNEFRTLSVDMVSDVLRSL